MSDTARKQKTDDAKASEEQTPRRGQPKKELRCGICKDKFRQPKQLSCLHSFCLNCLRKYVEKGGYKIKFPCPVCDWSIEIPKSGGLKSLPANMYVVTSDAVNKTPQCDICGTGALAASRCLECEENMCGSCLTYHSKMRVTRVHHTASIGEDIESTALKVQQKQFCDKHGQEELNMYCVPCAKIICRDCKGISHTVHEVMEIQEVAKSLRQDLRKSTKGARGILPKLAAHTETLNSMAKSIGKNTENATKEIKAQAKKLHEEIDKMASDMIADIKRENKEMGNKLEQNIKATQRASASIESIILGTESFVNIGSDHDMLENCLRFKNRLDKLPDEIPREQVDFIKFKFLPGPIPSMELKYCFGKWTSDVAASVSVPIPSQEAPAMAFRVHELGIFPCVAGRAVISVAPSIGGNAWICSSFSEHIFLYGRDGQCKSHVNTGFEVGDLLVASDGSVVMSSPSERKIQRLTSNGEISDVTILTMDPAGIAENDQGEILVCAAEKVKGSGKETASKGVIVKVNRSGKFVRFINNHHTNLLSRPVRVTVNANEDIIVADWKEGNDHVIGLTPGGKLKWRYFGCGSVRLKESFMPNALATDKYCHILIADSHNNSIHLLDKDGNFLRLLMTAADGIREPWSIAVDSDEFLWVGDADGIVKVFKYLH